MHVLMFEPRFVPLVRSGRKKHTIRPERARPIRVTDAISLRKWRGVPYRSNQVTIARGVAVGVEAITIDRGANGMPAIEVNGVHLLAAEAHHLAIADGFRDVFEFLEWRDERYGLPWSGVLIRWHLLPAAAWRRYVEATTH